MDKKNIIIVLLAVMLFLVFVYIGRDVYWGMKQNLMFQGYAVAIEEMIEQAKNEDCDPFPIFLEEKEVHLINIDCLQQEEPMPEEGMMPGGEMMPPEEDIDMEESEDYPE